MKRFIFLALIAAVVAEKDAKKDDRSRRGAYLQPNLLPEFLQQPLYQQQIHVEPHQQQPLSYFHNIHQQQQIPVYPQQIQFVRPLSPIDHQAAYANFQTIQAPHVKQPQYIQQPLNVQQLLTIQQPFGVQQPLAIQQPLTGQQPLAIQQPLTGQQPLAIQQPLTGQQPFNVQQPLTIPQPFNVQQPLTIPQPFNVQKPLTIQQPHNVQQPLTIQKPLHVQQPLTFQQQPSFDQAAFSANSFNGDFSAFSLQSDQNRFVQYPLSYSAVPLSTLKQDVLPVQPQINSNALQHNAPQHNLRSPLQYSAFTFAPPTLPYSNPEFSLQRYSYPARSELSVQQATFNAQPPLVQPPIPFNRLETGQSGSTANFQGSNSFSQANSNAIKSISYTQEPAVLVHESHYPSKGSQQTSHLPNLQSTNAPRKVELTPNYPPLYRGYQNTSSPKPFSQSQN